MRNDPFQTSILMEQFGCGLGPNSRNARNVIGTVAHHAQQINDLYGIVHIEFFADFVGPPDLCRIAAATGSKHANLLGNQLAKILVRGHHVHFIPLDRSLFGQESNHIVCLETHLADGRNVQPFEHFQDPRNGTLDVFRGFVAVGFVFGVGLVAERPSRRVENHGQVRR